MTNVWMRYGYDSDRNLIWEENAVELRTTFEYDAAGRRSVIVDVYGGRTTNTFDKAGNLVSSRNALGIETRMQYDLLSRLTNRIEALGTALQRQTGYRLDPVDNIVQTTRSDGSSTFYGYDAWGRLAQVSGTREYPVAYQYDENNRKTITTDGNGNATTNRYDKYGRLTSILHPDGAVEQFQYDLAGRLVALTDGNTNTTFLTFDALGRQVAESAPNSPNVTLYTNTYNPWNELIVRSNLMGGVERRSYDAFGRLTNSRDAAGLSLSLQYDAANRLVAVLWPAGSYVSNAYSGPFLAATRDRAGHWTGYAYDILGRRTVEVTSLGLTNTFDYDSLGRPALKSNSVGHVLRTDYDAFDQPIRITHPDGLIETVMYDAYGQVTNRFGAGQYPVMSQFDATGNRTNLIDGNANQTAWIHDKRNRVQRKLYVDGTSYDYSYDRNGNLRTRRDAKGVVTTYSYDVANRVTRIDYPTDQDVLFQYDALGRRTQMADESGTNRWYYDMAGRVLTNTQSRVNALLVYGYDSQGNRTKMSLNGFDTVYTYDAADRLSSISNTVGVFTYTWLPEANLVQAISYPNGAVVSNAYNRLGWLSDRRNLKADGNIVSSFTYGYDTLGLRTNVLFADGSRSSYAYDTVRQLTSAAGYLAGGSVNTNYQYLYAYDDAGNRTSMKQSGQLTTYYPNELNQYVVSVTLDGAPKVTTFAYDANGSLTQESSASSALSYSWDQENRLSIVTNGTHRTEFLYNGLSLRVESREYENGFIQETARYIYDGPLPVAEVDGANTLIRTYARGLDLSLGLETAGGIGGLLSLSEMHEGAIAYYFSDGNGNVVDLLAQDSSEAAHYEYDPFGDALVASGPLSQQPFQWSTKERIAQHRLTYFGQRYFGMRFARWLSRDPWYDEAYRSAYVLSNAKQKVSRCKRGGCLVAEVFEDANLYAFVRNDALNEVDYWGLMNTCLNEEAYRRCKEAAEKDLQTCFDNADRVFKTCMEGAERFNKECMKVCAKGPRDVRPICEWTCGKIKGIQEDLCAAIRFGAYPGCRINYIDRLQSCREDAEYTVPDDCPCR
jgi:RHS repeat-associated protein